MNNICAIFEEKDDWYDDAADASEEWGSPIPIMMAIMHQESRFQADARPPRKKLLGFIPGPRLSNAYGYPQAKTGTWGDYKKDAGRFGADRDDFSDAVDFIGWYNYQSVRRSGISPQDTYGLYLAYHEGHGGYNRLLTEVKPGSWVWPEKCSPELRVIRRSSFFARKICRVGGFFDWF